jgi:hypothetical protein
LVDAHAAPHADFYRELGIAGYVPAFAGAHDRRAVILNPEAIESIEFLGPTTEHQQPVTVKIPTPPSHDH